MLVLALGFLPFAVSASFTPGPNNLMVTASAANFGLRRTLPHLLGIALGFPAMVIAIGLGLGGVFEAYPVLHRILKYIGAAYLLFLAWKIATAAGGSGPADSARSGGRPLTFLQAALFQWVNPKAWVMAVGAVTSFTTVGGDPVAETLVIAAVFGLVAFPSVVVWAVFGLAIGRVLRSPRARAAFNWTMAALLVASLGPILM